ncbi:MAG: hypothetical protein ACC663_03375 [Gammaproteobacteria bacterium]
MPLLSSLLFRISAYCRCRIINGPNQMPYLERYHLFRLPFGYQVYLHRFVASDPGRGLHNHPWNRAFSLVLSGQYEEIRMANARADHEILSRRIGAGHLNWIDGSVFHRINLIENTESWTLFVHGPKAKTWGFWQNRGRRYAFHDHDSLLDQGSFPLWWETAPRPVDCPSMRQPASGAPEHCLQT